MNSLTFTDIFIGDNGIVVLISAMILALGGNLFKKYQRYQSTKQKQPFKLSFWIKDNTDDMISGFFATYILVRLLSVVTPHVISLSGIDVESSSASDIVVIVAVFIGYYTDSLIDKLTKRN